MNNELTRRSFLLSTGATALTTSIINAQQLQVPDPPGKKLGWAIVGLGRLAINQILPAFAKCEKSRPVAFVTGDRAKGEKLAARYGVNPKNIYNYQNYDALRDNPEVDIIYIVLPNSMHAEYTMRGARGQTRPDRKADGEHAERVRRDDRRQQTGGQKADGRLSRALRAV